MEITMLTTSSALTHYMADDDELQLLCAEFKTCILSKSLIIHATLFHFYVLGEAIIYAL